MSTVDDLLTAYERLHGAGPEFGGDEEGNHGLTNHGPMAVEVMVRRGLDIPIEKWLDGYVGRLDDLPTASSRIDSGDWREALGDHRRVADWTAYFREQLRRAPWHDVLAAWWPELLPGIAAGSTHGVIRVGHAVRTLMITDHPHVLDELANGLAFWAARWRPIATAQGEGTLAPATALDALPQLPDQTGFIAHRIGRLGTLPEWPGAVGALRVPDDPGAIRTTLTQLIDAAVLRYLAVGRDAPVLLVHTATAPNAVLHCLPVLPQQLWRPSLAAAWTATAAITVMYASHPDTASTSVTGTDVVGNLLDRASAHRDEHVLKFADTAIESYARTGDRATIAAAHLAADLIAAPAA
ncbi:questin oxidase family protein [Kibdelosporangium aridum]|uniref:DUF4243 domain-containing protein n=1 Tax=Kibdelosporangium aridum TaxID=2030 RepID=A0A1Y5XZI7_KIBAR|nr:questin oxidase family protein [Kibdelosporangium aridum]SMD22520.1 Protein of unknown function [Kibdelosporangium aridum]